MWEKVVGFSVPFIGSHLEGFHKQEVGLFSSNRIDSG